MRISGNKSGRFYLRICPFSITVLLSNKSLILGILLQTIRLPEHYTVLAPDGSEIRELVQTNMGSMVHCALPPGAVSKPVSHRTVEEVWYFISGFGQVWRKFKDKESITEVEQGISLTIETGTHFQFRNTSPDETLNFIITTMPPWPGPDEAYSVPGRWPAHT